MGKIKHLTIIKDFIKKTPVFHISSLQKIVGLESTYTDLILHILVKKGELFRLTKGWYATKDDPTFAVFCFKPAYLGLQQALSIHNLWDQETNTIILTTKIVREGIRPLFHGNVLVKRIPLLLFFGVSYLSYGDSYVPVSDKEKTFLDLLYFDQPIDREVLHEFRKTIDHKKLRNYLTNYPQDFQKKVRKLI